MPSHIQRCQKMRPCPPSCQSAASCHGQHPVHLVPHSLPNSIQQFQIGCSSSQSSMKAKMRKVANHPPFLTLWGMVYCSPCTQISMRTLHWHLLSCPRSLRSNSNIHKSAKSLCKGESTKIANQWTRKLTPLARRVKTRTNKGAFLLHGGRLKGQTERQIRPAWESSKLVPLVVRTRVRMEHNQFRLESRLSFNL